MCTRLYFILDDLSMCYCGFIVCNKLDPKNEVKKAVSERSFGSFLANQIEGIWICPYPTQKAPKSSLDTTPKPHIILFEK